MKMYKSRTTEEAQEALSNFCKCVGTAGDKSVHIFSIPVDPKRDADCILADVIAERDLLKGALILITELTWDMEYYETGDSPGAAMIRVAQMAIHGPYDCSCGEEAVIDRPCQFCRETKELPKRHEHRWTPMTFVKGLGNIHACITPYCHEPVRRPDCLCLQKAERCDCWAGCTCAPCEAKRAAEDR